MKLTYAWAFLVFAGVLLATAAHANPNAVDVEFKADEDAPDKLTLYRDNQPIDIIEFTEDKKFIRFHFPDGYADFDLKVFEQNEVAQKQEIMKAYADNVQAGIESFNSLWRGHASSAQNAREFQVHSVASKLLVVRNKNVDGTPEGVLHDYIIRFTVNGTTYLLDPSIRNTRPN
ncbi:hypothetical protein HHX48_05120 [Salinimonas sp. HHU 13199]|uniref:Uncharacterized protein n=1 Tax=Salinimonas profundi TaxID=2729140 RepID=A0ABR8LMG6_9ALTE|nr:hypothetical protein [Salinimonas profundi]MBD3585114.1 hypothetical protein [Salinimonas profundi]